MTRNRFTNIAFVGLVGMLGVTILMLLNFNVAFGSAPSGLQASVATTSVNAVTNTQSLVFATSSCSARIITTSASNIMVTFGDKQGVVPTGSIGHIQAASTTVTYDGGVYGCDALRIFSYATQNITVTETR